MKLRIALHGRDRDVGLFSFDGDREGYLRFENAMAGAVHALLKGFVFGPILVGCEKREPVDVEWILRLPKIRDFDHDGFIDMQEVGDFVRFCMRGYGGLTLTTPEMVLFYADDCEFLLFIQSGHRVVMDLSNIVTNELLAVFAILQPDDWSDEIVEKEFARLAPYLAPERTDEP